MTEPALQVEAAAKREGRCSRFRGTLWVCAAMVAFAGLSGFPMRDRLWPPKQTAPAATQTAPGPGNFPLQLDVEAQGKGLNIRWNPQSVSVTQAREGHLVILEPGQQPQIINLDPAQLTSGHVYYQSSAERLEFRLEVLESSETTAKEPVLTLSSKPASLSDSQAAGQEPSTIRQVQSIPIASAAPDRFIVKGRQVSQSLREASQANQLVVDRTESDRQGAKRKLEGRKVSFIIAKNHSRELASGISLGVTGTDVTSDRVNGWMWLMPDRRTIWLRNQGVREPVVFYGDWDGKRRELLITNVTGSSVTGYLLLPGQ